MIVITTVRITVGMRIVKNAFQFENFSASATTAILMMMDQMEVTAVKKSTKIEMKETAFLLDGSNNDCGSTINQAK